MHIDHIDKAIEAAKTPGPITCPECQEELFSPMDKLSVGLYGKCSIHLTDDGYESRKLLTIAEAL